MLIIFHQLNEMKGRFSTLDVNVDNDDDDDDEDQHNDEDDGR